MAEPFPRDGHERDLLASLRRGSREARDHLLEGVYPRLFAYLCRLSGSQEEAADLAQETALRIWRALPSLDFRGLPSFQAWAHKVARSAFVDALRHGERSPASVADPSETETAGVDPADAAIARTDQGAAIAAVARLPAIYREVIVLRLMQGLSYREVAAVMEIPPGTVRSRLAKALELLRRDLNQQGVPDDVPTR